MEEQAFYIKNKIRYSDQLIPYLLTINSKISYFLKMKKIKKNYYHLLLLFSFCITTKSSRRSHILNDGNQQLNVSRNLVHTNHQFIKNLTKPSIKNHLKKLSNPKFLFKISTFIVGITTSLAAGEIANQWGHWTTWNHFYPNHTETEKKTSVLKRLTSMKKETTSKLRGRLRADQLSVFQVLLVHQNY